MADRTLGALRVVREIVAIASGGGDLTERAEALLEPLHRLVPYSAAWVSLLDPRHGEQSPLVSRGHPDGFDQHMSGPAGVADVELVGLTRERRAIRLSEAAVPLDEVRSWAEFLKPAGFRNGLATGLFADDGRYLGVLGLSTDTDDHPTAAARDLLTSLVSTVSRALDPMRSLGAAALIVRDARAGVVLTAADGTLPLPGLPGHPLLRPGSPVLRAAAAHAGRQDHSTFLCPQPASRCPAVARSDRHLRVTVLARTASVPRHLAGVAVLSPPGPLHGLSRIELEILGRLIEDWSLPRIAAALAVPPRTVAAHLEAIQARLGAPSATQAVLRALRQGLYVPIELATGRS
ncbi:LuxR C-terminal-related transcriptional regulator [Phytohabitans kaempferiae]|uniref:LuxR C-terminal-related transcriptional regulator n=1 Tax=Phytohabitans kaempferiae TaxID=1620943 RepID=A0ABV6M9J1_9ACTN